MAGTFPTFLVEDHPGVAISVPARSDRAGMRRVWLVRGGEDGDSIYVEPTSLWEGALEGVIALIERGSG
ncbi:MAG: hypothetical protein HC884_19760 [Chloroflexaceae bacterium]|nr:hypothetical protein [Chloroflexaceae bacterium]